MHEQYIDRTGAAIAIRPYRDEDLDAICAVHDRSRPDELRGSCDPRAFVPLAEDQEYLEDVRDSQPLQENYNPAREPKLVCYDRPQENPTTMPMFQPPGENGHRAI